jgi:hypothetical protein
MNFVRRALSALGGIFLAALLIAALAPRAAHAVVAALVTVTNTTANPVGTSDANNGAFQPVHFRIALNDNASSTGLIVNGPTIPANKRLVIENISVFALIGGNEQLDGVWLFNSGGLNYVLINPQTIDKYSIGSGDFQGIYDYNRPVIAYYDPGDTLQMQIFRDPIPPNTGLTKDSLVNMYITGHYVDIP